MKYLKIFPNCKIVLGKKNAVIHDLERGKIELLPVDFAEILLELDKKIPVENIKSKYTKEEQDIIDINLQYIVSNEYGILCSEELFSCFPNMDSDYIEPNEISNAIIELKSNSIYYLKDYLLQLEDLGCFDVSIVFYEKINEKQFLDIFEQIPQNRIKSVEIVSKWHEAINDSFFLRLNAFATQITKLSFSSSPFNRIDFWDREKNIHFDREFVTTEINNFSHCGKVSTKYFNTNMFKYLEAFNHNSCLHKKIAIDLNGNITNCPAFSLNFGNVKENTLKEVINLKDFKKYWNLSKDEIEVCRDCEFRYVCTDCRAYTEQTHIGDNGLDISKPLKCGYDPYTGIWEEWSENPLKQKAMLFYGFDLFQC